MNGVAAMVAGGVAAVVFASSGRAQCAFSTSIFEAFQASGSPTSGQRQNPGSGWTYERAGASGRALLEGVTSGSWTGGAWGSPERAFMIPLAGPIYSPNAGVNQNPYYRRPPSFDGIMLHPDFGADHARAVLTAQGPTTMSVFTVRAEDLGSASPSVVLTAFVERASGSIVPLIPATTVLSLAPAVALTPSGVLPLALAAGDRVVVETSDGGNASEDWLNVNAEATLSGPPFFATQPQVRANCDSDATALVVTAGATSYRWRRNGVPLTDGPTGTGSTIADSATPRLRIVGFGPADAQAYDCVAGNTCGSSTSLPAVITRCFADYNCDGFLDFFDYDDFVTAFESGDPRADYNGDGFLDFFDYDDFVTAFESGC